MSPFPPGKVAVSGPRRYGVLDLPITLAAHGRRYILHLACKTNRFGDHAFSYLHNSRLGMHAELGESNTCDGKFCKQALSDTPSGADRPGGRRSPWCRNLGAAGLRNTIPCGDFPRTTGGWIAILTPGWQRSHEGVP